MMLCEQLKHAFVHDDIAHISPSKILNTGWCDFESQIADSSFGAAMTLMGRAHDVDIFSAVDLNPTGLRIRRIEFPEPRGCQRFHRGRPFIILSNCSWILAASASALFLKKS